MFEPGDPQNREFWIKVRSQAPDLAGALCKSKNKLRKPRSGARSVYRSTEAQGHPSGQGCGFLLRSPRSTRFLREGGEGSFELRAGFAQGRLGRPKCVAFHKHTGRESGLRDRSLDGLAIESTLEGMRTDVRLANRSGIRIAPDDEDCDLTFDDLVDKYEKKLYNLILRHVGDPDEAADLTQDTFVNAFRGFPAFRGECKIHTWSIRLRITRAAFAVAVSKVCRTSLIPRSSSCSATTW